MPARQNRLHGAGHNSDLNYIMCILLMSTWCADAYDATLGLIHTWVVRAGIKTGMLGLPTREQFFKSIGETGELKLSAHAIPLKA